MLMVVMRLLEWMDRWIDRWIVVMRFFDFETDRCLEWGKKIRRR